MSHERKRFLLAHIAAHDVYQKDRAIRTGFPLKRIHEMFHELADYDDAMLREDLRSLTMARLLFVYNTGHSGYGDSWVEGEDHWRISPLGLITLWTER